MSASERDTRSRDDRARRLAQGEFSRPLLVEAGAGTGKTATLVARVLAWSLGPGWAQAEAFVASAALDAFAPVRPEAERIAARVLHRVVAITFTEAAAAEMARRVTEGLARVAAGGHPVGFERPAESELEARARALLATADQLHVRTIHSFCRRLLAEHPFEAGLHPRLEVDADGTEVQEIVRERVEEALVEAYGADPDEAFLTLAGRGIGPVQIAEALEWLAGEGLQAEKLETDPFADEERARLGRRFAEVAGAVHQILGDGLAGASRVKNAVAIREATGELASWLEAAGTPEIAELREKLEAALPKNLQAHLGKWRRGQPSNAEAEALGASMAELGERAGELERLARHVLELDPELLGAARRALAPLLAGVRAEMRRRGLATFNDLLREARDLLVGHPKLRSQVRRGIDQLLVDEFQDTDRLQCDVVRYLALDGPAAERPGLFVVGDPKQSIYGWRSADLAAYEAFAEAMDASGGERLALIQNFRSVPAILEEVERAVEPVMRRRPKLQPAFEALVACEKYAQAPGYERAGRGPVEYWLPWARETEGGPAARTPAEAAARLEARAVAADLLELHRAEGLEWAEVVLLLRSTGDLETYLGALREAGIPFAVSRDRQYYRRREIIEAAALVRTILAPEDHLALVTLLRSAAVGVPDAALAPLWARHFPRLMTQLQGPGGEELDELRRAVHAVAAELPSSVPGLEQVAGWELSLIHTLEALAELRRTFREEPSDLFVEKLRRLLLFEPTEAARYLGPYRAANLDRFFAEVETALEQAGGDRHRVLRLLRHRIERGFEAEEAPPREVGSEAVQVMTIHQAKGLEFAHVYLLQTHKRSRPHRAPLFEFGELEDGAAFEYRLFGAATPGFDRVAETRSAVESAERVRLLYVALTRAAQRLVVLGDLALEGEPTEPDRAETHADLLGHRRGGGGSRAELEEQWKEGDARRGRAGAIWYLPAIAELEREPLELAEPEPLPAAQELARAQEELRQARERALEHQHRPRSRPPSKLGLEEIARPGAIDAAEQRAEAKSTEDEPPASPERQAAQFAGTAVHRILEGCPLDTDLAAELESQRRSLEDLLRALGAEGEILEDAKKRADDLLGSFLSGKLFERFAVLGDRIVARELPVLLPPGEGGAVGYLAGSIDLLIRGEEGELVVIDFKTDRATPDEDLEMHAEKYADQGRAYVRALTEALALERPPRFELWYLAADRAVEPSL